MGQVSTSAPLASFISWFSRKSLRLVGLIWLKILIFTPALLNDGILAASEMIGWPITMEGMKLRLKMKHNGGYARSSRQGAQYCAAPISGKNLQCFSAPVTPALCSTTYFSTGHVCPLQKVVFFPGLSIQRASVSATPTLLLNSSRLLAVIDVTWDIFRSKDSCLISYTQLPPPHWFAEGGGLAP